jgi:DNA-binding beta-propeller fold protein YncE
VNYSSNNVTVIDGAGSTSTVSAGTTPCAVAVNETTNKAYVANRGSDNVTVISYCDIPTLTTTAPTNITSTTADSGGNVTSDGGDPVSVRGVCWSTSPNPDISGSHTTDGSGTGVFTSNIAGLSPHTGYHMRAYATNSAGTSYGDDAPFITYSTTPTITTTAVTGITSTTASSGGNVTADGGASVTARGVCWGTSPNPDTLGSHTTDGSGLGIF